MEATRDEGSPYPRSILQTWLTPADEYVQCNVASEAAAKLIQTFLLNTMASSEKQADDEESEADESADDTELPPLKLLVNKFQ